LFFPENLVSRLSTISCSSPLSVSNRVDAALPTPPQNRHNKPKFIIDAAERQLEWLEKYVK
jgi:hypothetical protein